MFLAGRVIITESHSGGVLMNGKTQVFVEVPVVFFTDDLWIKLEQEKDEVVVNAHSNSRVGKSDLGENRRHLLQILEKLDAVFGNANS